MRVIDLSDIPHTGRVIIASHVCQAFVAFWQVSVCMSRRARFRKEGAPPPLVLQISGSPWLSCPPPVLSPPSVVLVPQSPSTSDLPLLIWMHEMVLQLASSRLPNPLASSP